MPEDDSEFPDSDYAPPGPTPSPEAYDAWFRAKIEKRLNASGPSIPHEVVMVQVQARLDRHKKSQD
ncbi:addiction module antitoxin [Sphingomonas sp.]|uniref:antitoxin PaaA2 family protein n=1 Tax=Sphingomonas sp. TaxID=28214 RepID=UPI0028AD1A9D|nr:addiction module antitoxin [Sphingomonas sp.]